MRPLSPFARPRHTMAMTLVVAALAGGATAPTPTHAADDRPAATAGTAPDQPLPGEMQEKPFELRGRAGAGYLEARGLADDVADNASLDAAELLGEMRTDPALFVTSEGMVGYTEPPAPMAAPGAGTDAAAAAPDAAIGPSVDVFDLSSRPTTTRTLYLDFTGHTTVDDYWNSNYGIEEIVSAPFDLDGNPASFSDTERQRIYDIWTRVADDYAPFDVDVTTRDPGLEGMRKTGAGDVAYGIRVVISPTDWYYAARGSQIGGIALIDVFDSSIDHPAFVFSANLSGGAAKTVAEAAAHEAGHNFGLFHDGQSPSSSYYAGHGDWAPIMGVGYSKSITQWSKGEYTNASNTEDDLAIIMQNVPVAPDDHGNSPGAATHIAVPTSLTGTIAVADTDVFSVDVAAGAFTATLTPTGLDLHASITIRDSNGATVATATPGQASGWTDTASVPSLPAGTYTITVAPTGWLTATTGFTSYASLGGYALSVSAAPGGPSGPTTTTPTTPTTTPTTTTPPSTPTPPTTPSGASGSSLVALTPVRLVDTRSGLGGSGRLAGGSMVGVQIAGSGSVPTTATAAVLTVTAVAPSEAGFLSVLPCATGSPDTSVVNYAPSQTVANTTIATLDATGRVCVWSSGSSDVLVDITGWMGPVSGSKLTTLGPVRVADTRTGQGGSTRLPAGGTMALDLGGWAGPSATAVALNITVVDADEPGFLTAYPCGAGLPTTSTVNHGAHEVRPNNTIVGLTGGMVCVFSHAAADVLVDLVGVFGPTGLTYVPTAPTRIVDTRLIDWSIPAGSGIEYAIGGPPGAQAAAAFVNVTAVGHSSAGYTSTFACDRLPDTSTLNQSVGQIAANGAIVPATAEQTSCAWMLGGGHLVVDLSGWWIA